MLNITNYEEGKYKTLSSSDFKTTEKFEYEYCSLRKKLLNPVFWEYPIKCNLALSSKSNLIKWRKIKHDISKSNNLIIMSTDYGNGIFRRKIRDDAYYLGKKRDNYISDIHNLYNIYLSNIDNPDSIGSLFWYITTNNSKKALEIAKYYLNDHTEEFIQLFLQYIKYKFFYKDVYLHQSILGSLPYVFTDKYIKANEVDENMSYLEKKYEKKMELQQMRTKLLSGSALMFVYNGLIIEVKQPIINTSSKVYDFSKSVFINNKPISRLTEEEDIIWRESKDINKFKSKLFELIGTSVDLILEEDTNDVLLKHIIYIRPYRKGEMKLYEAEYIQSDGRTKKKQLLYEFNEERVKLKLTYLCQIFENQITNIKLKQ